jgi:hypothetical protein
MLHDGIKINGHPRSEESIQLLRKHLVRLHDDGDDNSLFVRFGELLRRIEELEFMCESNWRCFISATEQQKKNKDIKDENKQI